MIVDAFAKGDKPALKNLLSKEVFDGFANAIDSRGQAGEWERHRHFDGTFAMLLDTFDTTVGIEKYAGLGLDECGFFHDGTLVALRRHWREMANAFTARDRAAYSKAAADFAKEAAIFTVGVVDAPEGGAE